MARQKIIRCVLSGSFHKGRPELQSIYNELITCGCQVLSPHRLDFGPESETVFARDTAEVDLTEEAIEKHQLTSIKQSDFLWLHAPNGYVGLSAAFEIGYAVANKIPIFAEVEISEPVFKPFVQISTSVYKAIESLV
jgi:nucleoside 2-deoxyribosyltransferase